MTVRDVPTPDRTTPFELRLARLEERVPADNLLRVSQVPLDLGAKLDNIPENLKVRLDRIEQQNATLIKMTWAVIVTVAGALVTGAAQWIHVGK